MAFLAKEHCVECVDDGNQSVLFYRIKETDYANVVRAIQRSKALKKKNKNKED